MTWLLSTWPRRLGLAIGVAVLVAAWMLTSINNETGVLTMGDLMKRLVLIPGLMAIAVFSLATSYVMPDATAATPGAGATPVDDARKPFLAQVVGLEWLNPLQRRDYPTEWQTLWTLGLVKPNRNDDMVRTDPKSFTSLQPVAIVANGVFGEETFEGFHKKYVTKLLLLFRDRYAMNPSYFYTVAPSSKRKWRELAGIHVEYAIPARRLDPVKARDYLQQKIIYNFSIGHKQFTDLWSKDTPPDVHVTPGGPNAGFTSLNAALDYLQSHPTESVWVMNWDAPSFPPNDEQMNENMVLLILAGPGLDTGRDPLAWIGRAASASVDDFEVKAGTTRTVQAWQSTIEAAARNANVPVTGIQYVIHDAGRGSDAASERVGALGRTLTVTLPEFEYLKQTFNTPALLGEMGAGTALTDVVLAIGRANHLGGNTLVMGTTDPKHLTAVVVVPPEKLIAIDPEKDWFRARGENNAYLPWWGRLRGKTYPIQGYTE
ncbi:virulence factor [Paraburkholderia pallida]|uniref:Virulence factor n=1 Tax=Paraburkholderia pallida TaxID=2547399 RepID=A0A4P7D8T1_9BURK|nr:virulence factor [Paraburkholderia pallida]QBR03590.1 virulence factor [Paraburkholderia pallida]